MPYITEERVIELTEDGEPLENPGDLNYAFSVVAAAYIEDKGLSYQTINDIVGALEGAKLEFYRRIAVPYEIQKMGTGTDPYESVRPDVAETDQAWIERISK